MLCTVSLGTKAKLTTWTIGGTLIFGQEAEVGEGISHSLYWGLYEKGKTKQSKQFRMG